MQKDINHAAATQNLQRYLRQLSYDTPGISAPPVDGIFESKTRQSLREFQQSQQLPVTGSADQRTWEALYAAYRSSLANNGQPTAIFLYPRKPPTATVGAGEDGFVVAAIQHMLQELELVYREFGQVTPTGIYDAPTEAAVRIFQERSFLPVTGEVDLLTWNSLADRYNVLFNRNSME